MIFKEKLLELRKQKGWSQEELGNNLDVSRQTISKWESGQSTPEMEKLVKISEIFEISLDELIIGIKNEVKDLVEENKRSDKPKKSKIKIVFMILLILVLLLFFGVITYRVSYFKKIIDIVEELTHFHSEDNYRITETLIITKNGVQNAEEGYEKEYYSLNSQKMMQDARIFPTKKVYLSDDGGILEFNLKTNEYKKFNIDEYNNEEYDRLIRRNYHIYKLIVDNINMYTFKDRLKLALDFSYKLNTRASSNVIILDTPLINNVRYSLNLNKETNEFTLYEYRFDENNKSNYNLYVYEIHYGIVSKENMERPDISEYTVVE